MKNLIVIILIFGSNLNIFCQSNDTLTVNSKQRIEVQQFSKKNTFSVDGGLLYLGLIASISSSINYERYFDDNFFIRTGFGHYMILGQDTGYGGPQIPLTINFITGKRNSHFEADLGGRIIFDIKGDGLDYSSKPYVIYPILNLGYRYQKPTGGFIFKALVGLDGLTLGAGYSF